jgi:hypothetical protein
MVAMDGQYLAYTFFRVQPAWRRLPIEEREEGKDAFAEVIESFAPRFEHLTAYSTTGVRSETDFFFWKITQRYEDLGELGAALNATPLAGYPTGVMLYSPNLTPDMETGIGSWTDGQLRLAIREGVDKEGMVLCPQMQHYRSMSDAELDSIIQYLRTLPPQKTLIKESVCPPLKR